MSATKTYNLFHFQERVFFPHLLQLKASKFGNFGLETCRYDSHCPGLQKCCLIQVAKFQFGMGCRIPIADGLYGVGAGAGAGISGIGGGIGGGIGTGYYGK